MSADALVPGGTTASATTTSQGTASSGTTTLLPTWTTSIVTSISTASPAPAGTTHPAPYTSCETTDHLCGPTARTLAGVSLALLLTAAITTFAWIQRYQIAHYCRDRLRRRHHQHDVSDGHSSLQMRQRHPGWIPDRPQPFGHDDDGVEDWRRLWGPRASGPPRREPSAKSDAGSISSRSSGRSVDAAIQVVPPSPLDPVATRGGSHPPAF